MNNKKEGKIKAESLEAVHTHTHPHTQVSL